MAITSHHVKSTARDVLVTIVVTVVTVWQDSAIAVVVGVIMSALVYAECRETAEASVHHLLRSWRSGV